MAQRASLRFRNPTLGCLGVSPKRQQHKLPWIIDAFEYLVIDEAASGRIEAKHFYAFVDRNRGAVILLRQFRDRYRLRHGMCGLVEALLSKTTSALLSSVTSPTRRR